MEQENNKQEKLVLENRRYLSLNGVDSVDGFSEQLLKLTVNSNKVNISGENIKIASYNKANGYLSAEGTFNEIKYGNKKVPIMKRLFK